MDPDVTLMKLLEGASAMAEGEVTHNETCEFANDFENLHEWLEKDGFAPAAWGDPEVAVLKWLLRETDSDAVAAQLVGLLNLPVAERPWRKGEP